MELDKRTWKHISAGEYFSDIVVPDNWNTLEDFVDWYLSSKMPMMIPYDAKVIQSDDAVAVCVFRKGQYQVEFYLEYPRMSIRKHSHPRMEVITMDLGGGSLSPKNEVGTSMIWGAIAKPLPAGNYHGGDAGTSSGNGFVTLAFQKWDDPAEMTSAAIQWKGELQGPVQAKLIKEHKPNAIIQDSYADVTLDKGKEC